MRKRSQYNKPKLQTKIPTLIIMIIMLVMILAFGKRFSNGVAGFFAPNVPVTDEALVAVPDQPTSDSNIAPTKAGTVVSKANQSAAQNVLSILSKSGSDSK